MLNNKELREKYQNWREKQGGWPDRDDIADFFLSQREADIEKIKQKFANLTPTGYERKPPGSDTKDNHYKIFQSDIDDIITTLEK